MNQEMETKMVAPEMLFCDGIAADDQNVWLLLVKHNILMRINRENGIMVPCGCISCESKQENSPILYRFLFIHEEKLILLPYDAKDICIYNIQEETFEHIELDMGKLRGKNTWRFTGFKKIDNCVVVYGEYSIILFIDLSTFAVKYLDLREKMPEDLKIDYWFWKYSYVKDKKIFFVPYVGDSCVIELDMCSKDVKYYRIPEENIGPIDNPVFDESGLFYVHRNREDTTVKLSKYNLGMENVETYDLNIENRKDGKVFHFVACVQGVLWMLPGKCEDAYKFYTSDGRLEKVSGLPTVPLRKLGTDFPYEFNYRNGLLTEKGHILAIHAWTSQLVDININSGNIKVISIQRSDSSEWSKLFNELLDYADGGVCKEWISGMLEAYLERENRKKKTECVESINSIGTKIYNSIWE